MLEHKLIRVEADAKDRCQGSCALGQCPYQASPGSKYCPRCGGNSQRDEQKAQSIRNYRLTQFHARVGEFADNDQIKSLREEIGILRMTLETILNRCQTDMEVILFSNKISDTVIKIEKLVATCHKLETATGQTMDQAKALHFAGTVVEVISRHVKDPEILAAISDEITQIIGEAA
jgi:hypothetical protein